MEIAAFIAAGIAALLWLQERGARRRAEDERDKARADLSATLGERDDLLGSVARLKREQPEIEARARHRVLDTVLGVDDDVRRARAHLPPDAPEDLRSGLDLLARDLHRAWERCDLERFEPEPGDPFDPELHEAIAVTDDPEVERATVVDIYSAGFRGERGALLRPARVRVARASKTPTTNPDDAEASPGSVEDEQG